MQRVEDGMAHAGEVIWAARQFAGRGQRNNHWLDSPDNLKMSLIITPQIPADRQFELSALVALTLAQYLQQLKEDWQVAIKWPNDIYINDKKACGVLIDNLFRGMAWNYSIIGIGLNVNQDLIPESLNRATSLFLESGCRYDLFELVNDLRSGLLNRLRAYQLKDVEQLMSNYNHLLYGRNKEVCFRKRDNQQLFEAFVQEVDASGNIVLLTYKGIERYTFGTLEWVFQ